MRQYDFCAYSVFLLHQPYQRLVWLFAGMDGSGVMVPYNTYIFMVHQNCRRRFHYDGYPMDAVLMDYHIMQSKKIRFYRRDLVGLSVNPQEGFWRIGCP